MFCLPKSQQQQQQQQQQVVNEEPNAFDLTWRNYLPSTSQLCPCLPLIGRPRQGILLDDSNTTDHSNLLISPPYYNDFYQANAVRGYLDDQHDREFDDLLLTNNKLKKTTSGKSKKRSKRKRYPKQRLLPKPTATPTPYDYYDDEEETAYDYHGNNTDGYSYYDHQQRQGPTVYEVYSDNEQQDAVYLGDDQIAHMVNNYDSGQQHEFYAPRTIPFIIKNNDDDEGDNDDDQYTTTKGSSIQASLPKDNGDDHDQMTQEPTVATAALAAQAILSETLEDLTEKLAFIRTNMMDIGSSTQQQPQDEDEEDDTATLHTMKTIVKKRSADRLSTSSDLDSIASEALHEYENTSPHRPSREHTSTSDYHNRRFSSNIGSDLHMPVASSSSSTPYSQPSHPFAYFTEPVDADDDDDHTSTQPGTKNTSSSIQGAVINFGRKWFG